MSGSSIRERINESRGRIQSSAFIWAIGFCVLLSLWFSSEILLGGGVVAGNRLECLIDPNYASVESLERLPGIGVGRAGAILDYRRSFSENNNGKPAFKDLDDLQKVSGIGPKTAAKMGQWLKFK